MLIKWPGKRVFLNFDGSHFKEISFVFKIVEQTMENILFFSPIHIEHSQMIKEYDL